VSEYPEVIYIQETVISGYRNRCVRCGRVFVSKKRPRTICRQTHCRRKRRSDAISEKLDLFQVELGRILIGARKLTGRTHAEIAEALDVSESSISRYETGASSLAVGRFVEMCDAIGADADTLLRNAIAASRDMET
jgi:DNA-binding XRE family transcriptional regulator